MPLAEVTTTQNALPPDFEGELPLLANATPVTPAASSSLGKCIEETAKHANKIDKQVMKQEAKQEAKQHAAMADNTPKAAGKRGVNGTTWSLHSPGPPLTCGL